MIFCCKDTYFLFVPKFIFAIMYKIPKFILRKMYKIPKFISSKTCRIPKFDYV